MYAGGAASAGKDAQRQAGVDGERPYIHDLAVALAGRRMVTPSARSADPVTSDYSIRGSRPRVTLPMYWNASFGENGCMKGPARTSR